MKILVWSLWLVFASLWTGLAALIAQATRWIASGLASGQVKDFAGGAAQWPMPAWLPAWLDANWVQWIQSSVVAVLNFLAELSPQLSTMISWLVPLIWVVWGIGLVSLLGFAGGAHWLIGRLQRSAAA